MSGNLTVNGASTCQLEFDLTAAGSGEGYQQDVDNGVPPYAIHNGTSRLFIISLILTFSRSRSAKCEDASN